MDFRSIIVLAAAALTLAGCAGGGSEGGLTTGSITSSITNALPKVSMPELPSLGAVLPSVGGSSSARKEPERLGSNLYRVPIADRKFDDDIQRENYALLRAAEAARDAGGTHFVVVNAETRTDAGPLGLVSATEPSTLVRVLTVPAGAQPPTGAVDAAEIIHFFGPTFGRG